MTTTQTTRRDGEATRQRLLRAALELYTTVGFRATTTPAIAARAGVAEGTIYRHFSGKEHLLNEVFRGAQRWGTAIVKETGEEDSVAGRLSQIARRLIDTAARDAAQTRMLLRRRDEQHLDERSREAEREFRSAVHGVVAAGRSEGIVRQGPSELWTDLWLALVAFITERVGAHDWPPDAPPVSLALDAAWDAIAAREAARAG
jgi:TetR/AcrR family transcriptional regulator, multidrug resistance operon repressor